MTRYLLVLATLTGALMVNACGTEDDPASDPASDPANEEEDLVASAEQASGGHSVEATGLQFYDDGYTLRVKGSLKGLEKGKDVLVKLEAKANVEAVCINPGGHEPPGRNPIYTTIQVTGYATISATKIKYGYAEFTVSTKLPTLLIAGAPDCPNANWTEKIVDLKFTSAKLTCEAGGKIVLIAIITFKAPTYNGPVRKEDVDCKFM